MDSKKILLTAFVVVAIVQLYVPAKMIWDQEEILDAGVEYRFKTAPIDPYDPFRGKYITLSFEENNVAVPEEEDWRAGESVYVSLKTDKEGFAGIRYASKTRPTDDWDFVKAKVQMVAGHNPKELIIEYPFNRYYMQESKAYDAEIMYRESQQDTTKVTYALVSVRNGEAVLKDVMIDGTPIREIVKARRKEANE